MGQPIKRILVADDEETIRRLLDYNLRKFGFQPVLAANGREAIEMAQGEFACALVDLKMPEIDGIGVLNHLKQHQPDVPVVIMSAVGQVKDAVTAMKSGALEYITKPFDLDEVLVLMASAARMGRALQENRQLRDTIARPAPDSGFAGESPLAKQLLETVARVAPLDSTVLITGESGVGKGLLARMIHRASKRAEGPFITTSCPALPRELLESEMFGHERGAFTGAQQRRIGRVEMAEGGTLFLDEIGDLPLLLQPKLLNVLQDRQFTRLGGSEPIDADIRLIAATNADLQEKVASREFREDLYYRLNVIPIHVPSLRERLSDLPVLCRQVLGRIAHARGGDPLELSPGAEAVLARYSWPGNIRELENVLERATAFCDEKVLEEKNFPLKLARSISEASKTGLPAGSKPPSLAGMSLDEVEKLAIQQTLELCRGNKAAAARHLGITEKSIYNKLSRYALR
jgi:DNA-binding NtrC family response regulator